MKKWITAFLLLVLFQQIQAQSFSAETKDKIDRFLSQRFADSLPGAAVFVGKGDTMWFEKSYGVRDTKSKDKITSFTNFNIASLSKQFTAAAILQLAEKGKLSLSDKLSRFFPDMNQKVSDRITIQQLLTHSSGIRDHYEYINTKDLKHAHNTDVYNAIKHVDSLYFEPGSRFQYSNTGYCLLALVIEKLSGLSYNDYMQTNIFRKADMPYTTIWREGNVIKYEATGFDRDSASGVFVKSGADEHIFFSTEGDGGIYTSLTDYQHWLAALQNGKIINNNSLQKMQSIELMINPQRKVGYGFGWFVDDSEKDKKVLHSGSNGGFRTYCFTIPAEGIKLIVFQNRSDLDVEETAEGIYRLLFPNKKPFFKIEVLTS